MLTTTKTHDFDFIQQFRDKNAHALTYALIRGDRVLEQTSFGFSNIERGIKADSDTVFPVASISKIVTAISIMILLQEGKISSLDDEINKYCKIQIRNPKFPSNAIIIRELLTHTSGIQDPEAFQELYGIESISIEDYVSEFLTLNGKLKERWCLDEIHRYWYSNAGFVLLGYLVEQTIGESFESFVSENIFIPLGIKAGWCSRDFDETILAMSYDLDEKPYGFYQVKEYPACQMRISINDLTKILMIFTHNNEKILSNDSVKLMCPSDLCNGLAWWGNDTWYGKKTLKIWSHGGHMKGVRTVIAYDPLRSEGYIILTNGETETFDIEEKLHQKLKSL